MHIYLYIQLTLFCPNLGNQNFSLCSIQKCSLRQCAPQSLVASKRFRIPQATISNKVTGRSGVDARAGKAPVIPPQAEEALVKGALEAADTGFGVSRKQLMRIDGRRAGQLCQRLNIQTPFKDGIPGKDWFLGLKARLPELSLRKPQKLSTARSQRMNKADVDHYFWLLGGVLTKHPIDTSHVWNMDESRFHLEHTPQVVCARKGARSVPEGVSCNRENITVAVCVNAAGGCMPPMIIVKVQI